MIKLKSKPPSRSRRKSERWLILLLVAAPLAGLVVERWRGQWALYNWKQEMATNGESLAIAPLWPLISAEAVSFSNQLAQIVDHFPAPLRAYVGNLSPLTLTESGKALRGSQATCPPLTSRTPEPDQSNTWKRLDALLHESEPALEQLRALMMHAPAGVDYDAATVLDGVAPPNFVAHRIAAQTLHASALNNLHQGDLTRATQDLAALLAFGKLGNQDPGLVAFMIRMAIIGLSIDVCWDALQSADWTEPQLAALQTHCLDITNLLSQLPHTMEAERVTRIHELDWFRSHSYQEWVARYSEMYAGFGLQPPPSDAGPATLFRRQWLFHPIWSFAWADQEELKYLQAVQLELTALRETAHKSSYQWLQEQITANRHHYRPPAIAVRFYGQLPLADRFLEVVGPPTIPGSTYPYPDFSKAWFICLKNLTLHEMVITAIALKRHNLRYSQPASSLATLVPEFLSAEPIDLMDGHPLRYQLNSAGVHVLYSIGANLRDDRDEDVASSNPGDQTERSPWRQRDWVWPQSGVNP